MNAAIYTLRGEWWRLWTSTFVHFSFWHVALNMVALWQSGRVAEALYGRPRFAIIYLGAGGLGSLASALFHLQTVSAGASGAIFGVYGALFAFSLHRGGLVSKPMFARLRNVALIFCGVNLLNGFTQAGVDNAAHLGGLAGGLILGRLLYRPIDEEGPLREPWARPTIVALAASFVLLSLPVLLSFVLPKAPAIVSNSASESVPSNSHPNAGVAGKPTPLPIPNSNAAEAAEDNLMGTRYRKGLTGEVNAAEAIRWFRKAADLGNPEAQYNLGDMYENGEGVSKSIAEALAWYTKAADHGESLAQDRLGHIYEGGLGIPKNSLEAIKWYTKAAEQGEVMDQYMLGELYSRGTDVPKNIAMATGWYRQAADQGFTAAQYRLREISGNGKRAGN